MILIVGTVAVKPELRAEATQRALHFAGQSASEAEGKIIDGNGAGSAGTSGR